MRKTIVMGAALVMAMAMTSCKSGESAYKKAYEKAQAQSQQQAAQVTSDVDQAAQTTADVTPVQQTQTVTVKTTDPATVTVRTETVRLVSGSGLKDFSVVVGSFGTESNATGLQAKLKGQGHDAQVVQNPDTKMYRVIISTFTDKASAAADRDKVRATYPDAWLLYNK